MSLPSVEELAFLLQKCRAERSLEQALRMHTFLCHCGLEVHPLLGNHLVVALADNGSVCYAQHVFDKLRHRRELSWSSLMSGYVKCGESQHALILYGKMQEGDSLYPSGYTLVTLLKACTALKDMDQGHQLHYEISRQGLLESDAFVGSSLVDMYAKCGSLEKAQEVFDKLPFRDVVSWTALIAGYAEHDYGEEALNCVKEMQQAGIPQDFVTILCALKACGCIGASNKGQELHIEITEFGFETNLLVASALVDMYANGGLLAEAQTVFSKLSVKDIVLWNTLTSAYVKHGHPEEALHCFVQMQEEGVFPDAVTSVCSLKACADVGDIVKGHEIHSDIVTRGLESELSVGNILVDMYGKLGLLTTAHEVFNMLQVRDVITWTALIAGYVEQGCGKEVFVCFAQMQDDGVAANDITFACILKACGNVGASVEGLEIHAEIMAKGKENVVSIGNTLVDMYCKFGFPAAAQEVFDKLSVQGVISWNALMAGYTEHGHVERALQCFEQMQEQGVYFTEVTFVCSLKACGSIEATVKGQKLHIQIIERGLETGLHIGSTLLDMYAKCGLLADAHFVFARVQDRDEILWNAMIAAYARVGKSEDVVQLFDQMLGEGIEPDLATFASVLNACSHAGLLDKGLIYFQAICNNQDCTLTLAHYACMVDLLGRAGHVERALAITENIPVHPDIVMWHTVLAACRKWGNVELGRCAFEHVSQMNNEGPAAYLCMYNIYADAVTQLEANRLKVLRVATSKEEEIDVELVAGCI